MVSHINLVNLNLGLITGRAIKLFATKFFCLLDCKNGNSHCIIRNGEFFGYSKKLAAFYKTVMPSRGQTPLLKNEIKFTTCKGKPANFDSTPHHVLLLKEIPVFLYCRY